MTELERLQRIRDFWLSEVTRLRGADVYERDIFTEWQREYRLAGMRTVRATAAVRRHSGAAAARVGPRS